MYEALTHGLATIFAETARSHSGVLLLCCERARALEVRSLPLPEAQVDILGRQFLDPHPGIAGKLFPVSTSWTEVSD
jgi:hypothetical protein